MPRDVALVVDSERLRRRALAQDAQQGLGPRRAVAEVDAGRGPRAVVGSRAAAHRADQQSHAVLLVEIERVAAGDLGYGRGVRVVGGESVSEGGI